MATQRLSQLSATPALFIGDANTTLSNAPAVSGYGTTCAFGLVGDASAAGIVKVYDLTAGEWVQRGDDITGPANITFGETVLLSRDGDVVLVTAPTYGTDSGALYVYGWDGVTWNALGSVIPGTMSASYVGLLAEVALSGDGLRLAYIDYQLGANGRVVSYEWNGSSWGVAATAWNFPFAPIASTSSLAYDHTGATLAIGSTDYSSGAGIVYVYEDNSGTWSLIDSQAGGTGANFGRDVHLSIDGTVFSARSVFDETVTMYEIVGGSISQRGSDLGYCRLGWMAGDGGSIITAAGTQVDPVSGEDAFEFTRHVWDGAAFTSTSLGLSAITMIPPSGGGMSIDGTALVVGADAYEAINDTVDVVAPFAVSESELTFLGTGFSVSAPMPSLTVAMTVGQLNELTLPQITLEASAAFGTIGSASLSLPQIKVVASGTRSAQANLILQQVTLDGFGYEVITGSADLTLPMILLSAQGSQTLAAAFQAFCMNVKTSGVSEYTEFPMTSLVRFNGHYYGTAADGIYLLEGADDDGTAIDADILGGIETYGTEKNPDLGVLIKRSGGAYLGLRCQGQFQVVAKVDEATERIYSIDSTSDPEGLHNRRVQLGRLLEGVNWQFGFRNVDGAAFDIRDFSNIPIYLSRRVG